MCLNVQCNLHVPTFRRRLFCSIRGEWRFEKGKWGTVLKTVGETRQSRFEINSCGKQGWWTGHTGNCSVLLAYWINCCNLKFVHPVDYFVWTLKENVVYMLVFVYGTFLRFKSICISTWSWGKFYAFWCINNSLNFLCKAHQREFSQLI